MENTQEQSREETPMYLDSYLLPKIKELHKGEKHVCYPRHLLLKLAEDIIKRATGTIEQGSKDALLDDGSKGSNAKNLPRVFGRLSSQMTSEILNGNDTHSITLKLLMNHLAKFYWKDKAITTLAAFAFTFGDFWLHVRIYADKVVNETMTTDSRELMTSTNKEAYRNQIEANNEFIKILVKSLRYLFDIITSRFGYVDMPDDRGAIYVYWIVRCAIVAATQIIVFSTRGLDRYLVGIRTPLEFEKLKSLNGDLMRTLSKTRERERALDRYALKSNQADVVGIMGALVTDKDMPPLYHGETKRKDHLDVLRGKRVLLLVSGIDIPSEDIESLKRITVDPREDEIVWIPVMNNSIAEFDPVNNQLETLQNSMPWYSVQQLSMVTNDAKYFFENKWGFNGTPILVLLSPSGTVLKRDAIHMVRTWQNLSVDCLTRNVERQLWEKETWNLKLLVNDIVDPIMQQWIQDKRYIILYGSNDIDWIRKFTRHAQSLASYLKTHVEMVYVGNRPNKDLNRRVQDVILIEQLSHCLPESSMTYFWTRFDSMIESKIRSIKKINLLLQEMIRFQSHEEWTLLARGSTILVNGPGQTAMNALEIWRDIGQSCYIHK